MRALMHHRVQVNRLWLLLFSRDLSNTCFYDYRGDAQWGLYPLGYPNIYTTSSKQTPGHKIIIDGDYVTDKKRGVLEIVNVNAGDAGVNCSNYCYGSRDFKAGTVIDVVNETEKSRKIILEASFHFTENRPMYGSIRIKEESERIHSRAILEIHKNLYAGFAKSVNARWIPIGVVQKPVQKINERKFRLSGKIYAPPISTRKTFMALSNRPIAPGQTARVWVGIQMLVIISGENAEITLQNPIHFKARLERFTAGLADKVFSRLPDEKKEPADEHDIEGDIPTCKLRRNN